MFKTIKSVSIAILLSLSTTAAFAGWQDMLQDATKALTKNTVVTEPAASLVDNGEVVAGLKEALAIGAQNAIATLGKKDGFMADSLVKITLPGSLSLVEQGARQLGQGQYADDFIGTMNSAAEQAVPEAADLLAEAIRNMSVADAMAILNGPDNAATEYFRKVSGQKLATRFKPIVENATNKAGVTSAYKMLKANAGLLLPAQTSSMLSGLMGSVVSEEEMDVDQYVTDKALDGLFTYIALEEKKIRQDPLARSTELLKRVFL